VDPEELAVFNCCADLLQSLPYLARNLMAPLTKELKQCLTNLLACVQPFEIFLERTARQLGCLEVENEWNVWIPDGCAESMVNACLNPEAQCGGGGLSLPELHVAEKIE
jgi:hypothetical protein